MKHALLIAVMALAVAGCDAQSPAPGADGASEASRVPVTQDEAEKIVADMQQSFTGGDAFKIMEHYAPDAVMFDPAHVESSADRAVQTRWAAQFVTMKPSDLVTSSRHVQVLDGDTIVASGIAAFLADVGPNRERLSVRYSQVFERQDDGSWKIAHEHMSMPPTPAPVAPPPPVALP